MLGTDRETFETRMRELFAGLDKPVTDARIEACWKGLAKMSLVEFGRCCDLLLEEITEDVDLLRRLQRSFTASDVWAAKRRLRARGAASQPQASEPEWSGDGWDIQANRMLLGYLGDQVRAGIRYCDDDTAAGRRSAREPSQETCDLTAPLLAYKSAWAQDMRELHAEQGHVTADQELRTFRDCMRRANAEVDQVRERYAQARRRAAA